jgi:hypothetical protein
MEVVVTRLSSRPDYPVLRFIFRFTIDTVHHVGTSGSTPTHGSKGRLVGSTPACRIRPAAQSSLPFSSIRIPSWPPCTSRGVIGLARDGLEYLYYPLPLGCCLPVPVAFALEAPAPPAV